MKKKILITGGSGYLGQHLAKKLSTSYDVMLGARDHKRNFMASKNTGCESIPLDVSNMESVKDVFNSVKPDIVVHAAATKFVGLSEKYPMECVDINITGSQNIARVAVDKGISTVVGISTDKVSPPVHNIYGLSKSVMEKMYSSMSKQSDTEFLCVRYGNVVWSTGSVFPLWNEMMESNGKIESTGPHMRRFFFTVDDAVNLVLTGLKYSSILNGKILARPMKAALIQDILERWVKKYGGSWEQIGERQGDRLDEFLIGETECPYSYAQDFDSNPHYVIDFFKKSEDPILSVISTEFAERLTPSEIDTLISFEKSEDED